MEGEAPVAVASTVPQPAFLPTTDARRGFRTPSPTPRDYIEPITPLHPSQLLDFEDQNEFPKRRKLNSDINDNIPRANLQFGEGLNFYQSAPAVEQPFIPTQRIAPVSALDFLATIALQREETGAGRSRSAEEKGLSLRPDTETLQSPLQSIPTRDWNHVPYSVPMTQSFSEHSDRRGYPSTFARLDTSEASFGSRLDTSDRPSTSYHAQTSGFPTGFTDFLSTASRIPPAPVPILDVKKPMRKAAPVPATKPDHQPEPEPSRTPTETKEQPAAEKSTVVEDQKNEQPAVDKREITTQVQAQTQTQIRKEPPRISLPSPQALERTVIRDPAQPSAQQQNVPEALEKLKSPDLQKVLSPFSATTTPPTWTAPRVSPVAPVARVSFEDPSRIAPVAPVEIGASSSVKLIRNLSASYMSPLTSPKQDPRAKNGRASTVEAPPTFDMSRTTQKDSNTTTDRSQQNSPKISEAAKKVDKSSPKDDAAEDANKGQSPKIPAFTQPSISTEKRNSLPLQPPIAPMVAGEATALPNAETTVAVSTPNVETVPSTALNDGRETNMPTPPPTAFNQQFISSTSTVFHPLPLPSPSKSPGKSPLVIRPTAPVVPRAGFSPISPPTDTSSPSNSQDTIQESQESPKLQSGDAKEPAPKEDSPVPQAAPESLPAIEAVGGLLELSKAMAVQAETSTPSTYETQGISPPAVQKPLSDVAPEVPDTEASTEIEEDQDVTMADVSEPEVGSDDTVLVVPASTAESFTSTQPDSQSDSQPSNDSCAICQGRNTPLLEGKALSSSSTTVAATSWIECDGCKVWYHMPCVNITDEEAKDIEKFHCPSCVISRGPSTYLRKSKRPRAQIDYEALNDGSTVPIKTVDKNHHYVGRILDGTFSFTKEKFARLSPEVVTMDALTSLRVWDEPIVIPGDSNPRPLPTEELKSESKEQVTEDVTLEKSRKFFNGVDRLGMRIPYGLTVEDVADLVGREHRMNVIDVQTQHQTQWPLGKWAEYYNSPDKDQIRNVISLEVSETKLGGLLKRPNVVEQLDLSDWAWPSGGKEARSAGLPTSVKLYCLMSVKDSYTDFHIDFGGSSVFYHIVRGKKTFFFIPPTDENLKAYEEWCNHPEQNYEWLAKDRLCYRVELSAGDTMLIPSGWIHAVYTPADSLVIGGNFLTRNHYVMQMKVHELERRTNVTARFRYPNFAKVHWYAAMRYMADDPIPPAAAESLYCGGISEKTASSSSGKIKYTKAELEGLPVVVSFLARNALIASGHISDGISKTTKANVAKAIPKSLLNFGYDFVKDFAIWVTWKRACGETIPVWARPGTAKGFGFPGVSEKNIQPLPTDRDENEIVEADRDAYFARFKRYASKTQRDVYTPSPEALPTILTTPRHAKEPRPRNSSKKRKEASDFDEDVMKEAVSRVSGHLALPKLTVLGPMKTACSTCSKKKVRCLHKDEVQKKQKEVHDLYQTILAERHSSTTPAYEQPPKKRRSSVSEIERTSKKARSVSIPESSAIKPKSSTVPPEPVGLDSVLMDDERAGPAAIPAGEMALEVIEEVEASPKPVVQPMVVVPVFPPPTAAERRTRTAKSTRLGGIVAKNGRKRACSTCRAVRRKCPHTPDGSGMVDEAELEKIGVNVQPIVRKVKSQAPVHREAEPLPPATVSTPVEVLEPRTAMQATTENPKEESFLPQLNGTDAAIEDDDSDRATSELTEIESDGSTFDGLDQRLSRDIPLIQVRSNNGLLLKFRFNKKKSAAIDLMETTSGKDATTLPPSSPNSRPDNRKSSISEHSEQRLEQSKTVSIPSTPRRADEKQLPMLLSPETRKGATATKRARASFSGALEEFIPQDIKRPRKERTASHGASNGMKRDSIGSLSAASLHDGDEFFEASKIQEFGLRRRSGGGK